MMGQSANGHDDEGVDSVKSHQFVQHASARLISVSLILTRSVDKSACWTTPKEIPS